MCGRVIVKTTIEGLMRNFSFADPGEAEQLGNQFPRYNGAPGMDYPIIILERDARGPVFISARWGLIPRNVRDPKGGARPINARAESVATNGMFKFAYAYRRALMPIDGYFEWRARLGSKVKQPYAIAMKRGEPFALAAIWETWRNPETGEDIRTFATLTCEPNEMMATIHDRMPVILHPSDYMRWLSEEPDPRDLLKPFPAELMTMWPVSTKVNAVKYDAADILDREEPIRTDLFDR